MAGLDPKTITLGTGIVTYNGVHLGYLSGDIEYTYSYEIEPFKSGQPKKLIKSATKEIVSSLTAGLAQLDAYNTGVALGGLPVVQTSGAITVSNGDNQERTFSTFGGYGIQAIRLDGPNVSALTVKDITEATTYVAGTDYLLLPTPGHVLRLAGGAITSGETVRVNYTWDPGDIHTVNLGVQWSLARYPLVFEHKRQEDQKYVKITMPLAEVNGQFSFNFAEETWSINKVTFNAVFDDESPDYPMGKIEFEQ